MARFLGVVAGLLWIVGTSVLVLVIRTSPDWGEHRSGDLILTMHPPTSWLIVGTVLVGAAGALTAGLIVRHLRGSTE